MTRGASYSVQAVASFGPRLPRRVHTDDHVGHVLGDWARAHEVASSAMKDAACGRPAWRAALIAGEIAPEDTDAADAREPRAAARAAADTAVQVPQARAAASAKKGRRPTVCACSPGEGYALPVCARNGPSSRPSTDSGSAVRARVRMISSGPSTMASCVG